MKHRLLFFRHAWWVAFLVLTIAYTVISLVPLTNKAILLSSITAIGLGFCYFAQRQHLEELRLFKELFTEFNTRYDELNDDLLEIRNGKMRCELEVSKKLVDYFNLCAEEFFFFRQGRIHDDVWQSWCRGMLYFMEHERIRPVWDCEVAQNSYYGLTIEVIRKGAS